MNALFLTTLMTFGAAAQAPTLVRVAVVDNSPSMSGPRIAAVRSELITIIRQLPPSPDFPLLLIVFHGTVEPTRVFTEATNAEQAVAALRGDGAGTSIAPALGRAHDELQKYRSTSNVLVMLFTDGEDSDQQGIQSAETQLDNLFAERSKQGLSQTVFVQRWGNANADLINRIRQHGHVQMLDAGELAIETITLDPSVALVGAQRDPRDPHVVHITYTPSLAVRSHTKAAIAVIAEFRCLTNGAQGHTRVQVQAAAPPAQFSLALAVPAAAEQAGRVALVFQVQPMPAPAGTKSFTLPLLPSSTVTLTVPLPPLAVCNRAAAEIRQVKAIRWEEPLALRARYEVHLQLTVSAVEQAAGMDRSTTFRISPSTGVRLASTDMVSIAGPGTYDLPVEVDLPLTTGVSKAPVAKFALELHPVRKPAHLRYDPPVISAKYEGSGLPAKVTTKLVPQVRRIGPVTWYDLVEPLAAFDADVAFQVSGPIPAGTTLTLVCPGNVRNNVLPPGTQLHTGETVVTLRVVAKIDPAKPSRLDFTIVPPAPTPAVTFQVAGDFSLAVVAPPAAKLFNGGAAGPEPVIHATVADNQETLDFRLRPNLGGLNSKHVQRVPQIVARSANSKASMTASTVPVFSPMSIGLRLPAPKDQPFFFDIQETIDLELHTQTTAAAVSPGRVQLCITRQAPFKRLLTYLAWAVFPLGIVGLAARMVRRLREPVIV